MTPAGCLTSGLGCDEGATVAPGPDLVWLTAYQPTAITERLTMLVLTPDREPTLLVPVLERPDAEAAEGATAVSVLDWADGTDPTPAAPEPGAAADATYGEIVRVRFAGRRETEVPEAQAAAVVDENTSARIDGLRMSLAVLALITALALFLGRRLPTVPVGGGPEAPPPTTSA